MEQKYHKSYKFNALASGVALNALRIFCDRTPRSFSAAELARGLSTSRSNTQRAIARLWGLGLLRSRDAGRRIHYAFNAASACAAPIFELFARERFQGLHPVLQNHLVRFLHELLERVPCEMVALFGSGVSLSWNERRDVDLGIVVSQRSPKIRQIVKKYFPDIRLDIHLYGPADFAKKKDFVILDILLHGVPLHGFQYYLQEKSRLEAIQKNYFLDRLSKVEAHAARLGRFKGPARNYFRQVIEITLGEMESILTRQTTLPKSKIPRNIFISQKVAFLHKRLAEDGNLIWLN